MRKGRLMYFWTQLNAGSFGSGRSWMSLMTLTPRPLLVLGGLTIHSSSGKRDICLISWTRWLQSEKKLLQRPNSIEKHETSKSFQFSSDSRTGRSCPICSVYLWRRWGTQISPNPRLPSLRKFKAPIFPNHFFPSLCYVLRYLCLLYTSPSPRD